MAEFVIQPQCKIPEFQRISMRVCGSIAQRLVFKHPCNHRLLTTEKVVYECKAIKLNYKFSRKNYLGLELFDCPKVCCVVLELQCSKQFFFELSINFVGSRLLLKRQRTFFRVYLLSSKHERRLGEFEKVMQTRHAVEGLHNFQEIFQPPASV